ncbi:MAG: hypothetical protein AAF747_10645, partial [Planctomycetota bacterium]
MKTHQAAFILLSAAGSLALGQAGLADGDSLAADVAVFADTATGTSGALVSETNAVVVNQGPTFMTNLVPDLAGPIAVFVTDVD